VTEQLRFLCVWLAIGAFVAVFWVLLAWVEGLPEIAPGSWRV
jgi:hypothetical protein